MAHVQIAVGLRWEAGDYLLHTTGGKIVGDEGLEEVVGGFDVHAVRFGSKNGALYCLEGSPYRTLRCLNSQFSRTLCFTGR